MSTGWNLYVAEMMKEKRDLRRVADAWHDASQAEKDVWRAQALASKIAEEMTSELMPPPTRKALTGFNLYLREQSNARKGTHLPAGEMLKSISASWNALSQVEKDQWSLSAQH